jgi:hypothetical protein
MPNKKTIIKKYIQNYNQPIAIIFDFKSQLETLITKEYDKIMEYKRNSKNRQVLLTFVMHLRFASKRIPLI